MATECKIVEIPDCEFRSEDFILDRLFLLCELNCLPGECMKLKTKENQDEN